MSARNVQRLYSEIRKPAVYVVGFDHGMIESRTPARIALESARDLVECDERGLVFAWTCSDRDDRGDFPDNASVLNRCEFEHHGRHIKRGSRRDCGNGGGRGHYPGELYSNCCYFHEYDVSACALVRPCEQHEGRDDYDPWQCDACDVLADLHGIEESRNWQDAKRCRREVEADLAAEGLSALRDAEESELTIVRGRE